MMVAITHTEHTAASLRRHAVRTADAAAVRWLLALALILKGTSARMQHGRPGWTGKRCATGYTATMLTAW